MKAIKNHIFYKAVVVLFVLFQFTQVFLFQVPRFITLDAGNLTSASDTLSNSRLSFYGKVSGTYAIGASSFTMQNSGNPDNNTNHLFPRDTVLIGSNNSQTVATVSGTTTFVTTTAITNQLADGNAIYATQSAKHNVSFTTVSTIVNGAIRVLIPAGDSTSASDNHLPDGGTTAGFDMNTITGSNVTCPTGGGVSWQAATATDSASFGNNYHSIECRFAGSLTTGAYTMTIGGATQATQIINPAPKSIHTQGTADTYVVKIQELQAPNFNIIDSVNVTVSPVEAVLVSATVNPSLTFSITGQGAGLSRCGVTTAVATTATTVPYGELTGSDTFYDAAHLISVATNATTGYVIKLAEDDDFKKPGTSAYIGVGTCDQASLACSQTSSGQWQTPALKYGWGYSLQSVSGSPTMVFNYSDTSGGNCTGGTTYCARAFACNAVTGACTGTGVTAEQQIVSYNAPTSAQTFYTCYRLNYGPTQTTGYYQTRLLYYASATF